MEDIQNVRRHVFDLIKELRGIPDLLSEDQKARIIFFAGKNLEDRDTVYELYHYLQTIKQNYEDDLQRRAMPLHVLLQPIRQLIHPRRHLNVLYLDENDEFQQRRAMPLQHVHLQQNPNLPLQHINVIANILPLHEHQQHLLSQEQGYIPVTVTTNSDDQQETTTSADKSQVNKTTSGMKRKKNSKYKKKVRNASRIKK